MLSPCESFKKYHSFKKRPYRGNQRRTRSLQIRNFLTDYFFPLPHSPKKEKKKKKNRMSTKLLYIYMHKICFFIKYSNAGEKQSVNLKDSHLECFLQLIYFYLFIFSPQGVISSNSIQNLIYIQHLCFFLAYFLSLSFFLRSDPQ